MKITNIKDKKLKIAFVSDAIYPYNKGGKEKRIYEVTTRLAVMGHKVNLYCMKWWKKKENSRIENGVNIYAISKLFPLYAGKRRSVLQAIYFAISCFKLLKEDFDVIDVDHMPHLVLFPLKLICLLKRKKMIVTWNEVWGRKYWIEYLGIMGNIGYIVEWLSARMPNTIIAVSIHTKNKLAKDLNVKKNVIVANNGIDIKLIKSVEPAKEKSDIIFAGRLLSHKNVDVLIKAIALVKIKFPKVKALIIGEGPEKNKIKNLIKDQNLNSSIHLLNFLKEQNDLYALMKSSKVFVFPSTREGFGIAALEANACGIPVITVNSEDNATKYLIINGENGYVTTLSVEFIAEKIINILSGDNGMNITIQNNKTKEYDWDNIAKQIEEIYKK